MANFSPFLHWFNADRRWINAKMVKNVCWVACTLFHRGGAEYSASVFTDRPVQNTAFLRALPFSRLQGIRSFVSLPLRLFPATDYLAKRNCQCFAFFASIQRRQALNRCKNGEKCLLGSSNSKFLVILDTKVENDFLQKLYSNIC